LVTFVVAIIPSAAIGYAANTGSVGTVSSSRFGGLAIVVIGSIAAGAGYLVRHVYALDPQRRPGEVWSTWFGGFAVLVIGTWFAPFAVLAVFVDSDHALDERIGLAVLLWTAAHLTAAALGLLAARGLLRRDGQAR